MRNKVRKIYMEVTEKMCRWCTKKFVPKINQQRYCDDVCAYRGKKKATFKSYLEGKEKQHAEPSFSIDWARDNDLYGLNLGKERYQE